MIVSNTLQEEPMQIGLFNTTIGDIMSAIEDNVCKKIKARSDVGKKKYGVTMEEEILSMREWLIHLQEELMDAAVYVEKLLGMVE
tara:strand:+ start:907 stop:1161 length:255 start_codon:yes stop_codon:yes gene_type:complete